MKKETLVLFSAPMLKAMLEGRKTLPGDCPRQGFQNKESKGGNRKDHSSKTKLYAQQSSSSKVETL